MKKLLNNKDKVNYRPEIDSLRAISIIAVIIYHAQINFLGYPFLPGGYLGVDIFFLISGYLITSIIFNDLKKNKFSFTFFYIRRARRILPALIFLLLCTLPFAWIFLQPASLVDFVNSILFSLGFSSNFYFYNTGLEYGAISGLLKPLLHTWSLAVEEQFYILFPLLLVTIFLFYKNLINILLIVLFFLSLIFAEYFSKINPNLNFYILPSRVWEILAGSLILLLENKIKPTNFQSNLMSIFGLVLILISFFKIHEIIPTPTLKNLIPIIGASLIIIFFNKNSFISYFLTNRILVSIGLISYSLYLWHYPIFSFIRQTRLAVGPLDYILVAICIFLISIFSYFIIEKPFRKKNYISDKFFFKIILIFVLIFCSISIFIIKNNGYTDRYPNYNNFNVDYQKYLNDFRILKYEFGNPQFNYPNKKNILIIGNSHARNTFNALKFNEKLYDNYEFSIIDSQTHCIINIFNKFELCEGLKLKNSLKKIFKESEIIIISSKFELNEVKYIELIVNLAKKKNKEIILTTNEPSFYFKDYLTIVDNFYIKNNRLPNEFETRLIEKEYFKNLEENINLKDINSEIYKISQKMNTTLLDKSNLICSDELKRCKFLTLENDKIIFDSNHYSTNGAKYLGKIMFEKNWLQLN